MPQRKARTSAKRGRRNVMRGVGAKEKRQYEHITRSARKTGRYKGKEKEVAARTVMKHHRMKGHGRGE